MSAISASLLAVSACSEEPETVPALTEPVIHELFRENFDGTIETDAAMIKNAWCAAGYRDLQKDLGVDSNAALEQALTTSEPPKNAEILSIENLRSEETQARATVTSAQETPVGDGSYRRVEYHERVTFAYERGRWRICRLE
ncbi:MAG: hypothetical protein QM809_14060 [Gordonia sp. (in: high G+C Gram-positive bacteria)]|uniref:hypothetical protein n=1 Tax=Gordonia sp. (in: high G+C Gram-positive bacteria) TaxID=84139 RepID=UPI0039E488B4